MIKVKNIEQHFFRALLEAPLSDYERKFVLDARNAQIKYSKLTRKRYVYFWLVFNKYFDIDAEEQVEIHKEFGDLKETSDAFKEWKKQKYNSQKLKRAALDEEERRHYKKKGDKHFS